LKALSESIESLTLDSTETLHSALERILTDAGNFTRELSESIRTKAALSKEKARSLLEKVSEKSEELQWKLSGEYAAERLRIEEKIARYETLLGIETDMDRVLEASCVIDRHFLETALITDVEAPERLFGDNEWLGHLKARVFLTSRDNRRLTPELITQLHTILTEDANPLVSGALRHTDFVGGDYKNLGAPTTYTAVEKAVIDATENIKFLASGPDPYVGYIEYPPYQDVKQLLTDLCNRYNEEVDKRHDPFTLAATLQRGLVSIHPFKDYNGRISRLLMNWSLQGDGVSPAYLDNPDADLTTSEEEWIRAIKDGSAGYSLIAEGARQTREAGFDCPADVFGLESERTFYRYAYRYIERPPMERRLGIALDHHRVKNFLGKLKNEHQIFLSETTTETLIQFSSPYGTIATTVDYKTGTGTVGQGGLVPESYIETQERQDLSGDVGQKFIREHYFVTDGTQIPSRIYRGGICEMNLPIEEILRFFVEPKGVTSSYEVNLACGVPMTSVQAVEREQTATAQRVYNHLLGEAYLARRPGLKFPLDVYLSRNVRGYGNGALRELIRTAQGFRLQDRMRRQSHAGLSPFVSTTFSGGTANHYMNFISTPVSKQEVGSFVVDCNLPKTGKLFNVGKMEGGYSIADIQSIGTFSAELSGSREVPHKFYNPGEQEVLVPGSIEPASINQVFYRPVRGATDKYGDPATSRDIRAVRLSLPSDPNGIYIKVTVGDSERTYRHSGNRSFQEVVV